MDLTEAAMLDMLLAIKMGQTEHVGCMAVLARSAWLLELQTYALQSPQ